MRNLLLLIVLTASPMAFAITPPTIDSYSQPQVFKNWLLDRCTGKISADKNFKSDAFKSASVWLEHSKLPIEAFNDGDKLINQYLNMKLTGAVEGNFNVLKCTLLSQSEDALTVFDKYNK